MASNKIAWSNSAVNALRQCNRKYYFAHVLANFGRSNPLRRKAFELKRMQSLLMWKGSIVDKAMELFVIPQIKDKKRIEFNLIAEQAIDMAKAQFEYSKNKIYTDPSLTKTDAGNDFAILDVHEINRLFTDEELNDVYSVIQKSILNIPLIKMPNGVPLLEFLSNSNMLLPNVNNWAVEIENARVKPQMDLIAYQDWKPVVVDWKVSESLSSDYSRQLIICGLTVYLKRMEKHLNEGKTPYEYSDIKLYEVNLLKAETKEHEFSVDRINDMIDYINLTSRDIALLTSTAEGEIGDIENFELTENESSCMFCNYRTLCINLLINNNNYDEKSYAEFVQSAQFA